MKTVGILGNGQLAELLTHSAYQLGIRTLFIQDFTAECDVITLENENIDIALLKTLQAKVPVYPDAEAVGVAQDRLFEKTLFQKLQIPTPPFTEINSLADLEKAVIAIGLPAVLKTRRFGYDGKGQFVIRSADEAALAFESIAQKPAILEGFIEFEAEVSLIAARNVSGETIFYPLIQNTHREGILRESKSPSDYPELQALAEDYSQRLLKEFNYVGVLAFEFFVKDQQLIANEIAPRVHNSGHLTIEGFNVSQFESHLRSILDLPLIKPILRCPTIMTNIIGTFPKLSPADYVNAHVYDYGKTERPLRKLGHITRVMRAT